MRVLYLSLGLFDKGGIARYGRYQVDALREILGRDSVDVLSLLGPEKGGLETPFSVQWHGSQSRRLRRGGMLVQACRYLADRPDIVWSGHVNLSLLGLILARMSGARPVLNVYGLEVWSRKRYHAEFGLRNTNFVVSDCEFTANYVNTAMPSSKRRTFVAVDCVDCDRFKPGIYRDSVLLKYGLSPVDPRFKVLMLGRISRYSRHKGWERLVTVAGKLKDRPILFIVAGDGDYRENLMDLVQRNHLAESFIFTQSISEEELVDVYRYADLFSLVSDRGEGRGEGLPLTPLEAAACGKPIIVGNQDGSMEAVEDNQGGFAIDPFDLDGHASLIAKLSEDRGLAAEIGRIARARVLLKFSFSRFKDTTAAIVHSIGTIE